MDRPGRLVTLPLLLVGQLLASFSVAGAQLTPAPAGATPGVGQIVVTERARAVQPGELVLLTVSAPSPVTRVQTTAFGRDWFPFRVTDTTWQVLIGLDLEVAPGRHPVTVAVQSGGSSTERTHELTVAAKRFPTRRLTVPPRYVDPPADVSARIIREAQQLSVIWAASAPTRLWTGRFVAPVPQKANSAFGSRSIFNGQARSPHGGADFPSPAGTPIAAPNAGRIVLAEDLYYTGQTVVIDHGLGLVSLLAHLSRIDVADGDAVARGQTVGLSGATGRVTGAHLHWTLRAGGARVDPQALLAIDQLPE
jgi:murein DD-endopeptidase MepM/ murein hydrolase activator NlpD